MINFIKIFLGEIISRSNDRNIFAIGSSHFSMMRQYYSEIKNLSDADYKVFSQTGEDGIIDYLLYSLNIKVPKFVEIGVGDYRESNTRYIFEKNCCRGMIIDKNPNLKNKVSKIVKLWKGDLTIIETTVKSNDIANILTSNNFDNNFIFTSLDFAQKLFNKKDKVSSYEIKVHNKSTAKKTANQIQQIIGPSFNVLTTEQQRAGLYKILQTEKFVVYLVFGLIIILSSFNIFFLLSMMAIEKKKEISVIYALGGNKNQIKKIFIFSIHLSFFLFFNF